MILYATALSNYSLKVRLAIALKGIAIDLRDPPGGYRSAEYKAIVPSATIPALVDGDFVLAESDTILEYLEDRFPALPLLPRDAKGRARARFLGRLHDLYLEPLVRKLFTLSATSEQRDTIQAKLDLVEQSLDAKGPFAIGPVPSLADCAYPATFAIIDALAPIFGWHLTSGPRTIRWLDALASHSAIEGLVAPYRQEVAAWLASKR
jgi:glutathione S-transferase